MDKYLKSIVFLVIAPIIFGICFYCIFCPDVFFVKAIDRILGLECYHMYIPSSNIIVKIMRCYLMDFLWAFSLTATVILLFAGDFPVYKLMLCIIVFETILEGLQLCPNIKGTFDILDIVVETAASILVYWVTTDKNKRPKNF